ncbi:hypothetical protein AN958_03505 [Leucoagaricus sp. SymC.cos]|nr:hypothetical protein AN958_03505 [Leucoagaricus sp. SymC.cos]
MRKGMAASPPASLKRKMNGRDDNPHKKSRAAAVTITLKPKPKPFASAPIPMPNACPDYPNGFIYCHQCSKKRDVTGTIYWICCIACPDLPRRNPVHLPRARPSCQGQGQGPPAPSQGKTAPRTALRRQVLQILSQEPLRLRVRRSRCHSPCRQKGAGSHRLGRLHLQVHLFFSPSLPFLMRYFRCPKCCDTCNCPRCRKSKGLEPMGSAGTIRKPPPKPEPKPPKQKADRKSKSKDGASGKAGSKVDKKSKTKPLPIVKWTSVPVRISLEDAEARFNIREFVLRFADLFEPSLPRANLEELEEIGGGRHQGRDEDGEMASWVSEFCVKSIIVGLLNLLEKELRGALAVSIKQAVKEIRTLGVNLNKIWPVLSTLRETSIKRLHHSSESDILAGLPPSSLPGSPTPSIPFTFTFPDPLPPPTTHDIRSIRSTRNNDTNDGLHIAYSAQMIPVITSLIEDVLLTSAIREEIESGVREGKERIKEQREAVKREAERWEMVRKGMETHVKLKAQILENRAKRDYHKRKLASLDNSLKILAPKYSPRLTPLGVDLDGRVYWILSPGVSEREAASDLILSCSKDEQPVKGKGGKKNMVRKALRTKVLGGEERREMRSWSWFVAVWGRKPEDAAGGALWKEKAKAKGKEKEQPNRGSVKLKIKVGHNHVQRKQKGGVDDDDDAMDVDKETHDVRGRDVDEEMASVSDREDSSPLVSRPASACTSTSPSPSASDDERSDGSQSDQEDTTLDDDEQSDHSEVENDEDGDDEENNENIEDLGTEKWWGFYDPLEILKLSDWLAIKTGLDSSDSDDSERPAPSKEPRELGTTTPPHLAIPLPQQHKEVEGSASRASSSSMGTLTATSSSTPGLTNDHGKKSRDTSVTIVNDSTTSTSTITTGPTATLANKSQLNAFKSLVEELRTFAGLLGWRCREDKYEVILKDPSAASGGGGGSVAGTASVGGSPAPSVVNGHLTIGGAGKVKLKVQEKAEKDKGGRESTGSVSVSNF